ncbi:MAG: PaaI family thioesterase [Thermoleophilia bacterium]
MNHRVIAAQHVSRMCLVCGVENSSGLKGRFFELDNGDLLGLFHPGPGHQGYPGRIHGGISSAMLDETIGRAINVVNSGEWGVTVELTVRYRKPVPMGAEVRVVGRITRDSSRLFEGTGEIVLADGTVAVEASGRYVKMPIDRIVEGDFGQEWFQDEGPLPDTIEL